MDELATLRALQSVKEHGTVTAAAAVLRLSPSAVSQQLKRLEKATGRSLLTPTGRRVALTPEAHALLDEAGPVLSRLEAILGVSSGRESQVAGHVRVAAFTTAIRHGALTAIAEVQDLHPQLTCSLAEMDPGEAYHALSAGMVDIAVTHHWQGQQAPVYPAITVSPLADNTADDLVDDVADVICHRDHSLAQSPGLEDLATYSWVSTGAGTICHSWLIHMFALHGHRPRITAEISDFALHVPFVAAGLGLALVPRLGRPELPGEVRVLELEDPPARKIGIALRTLQVGDNAISVVGAALRSCLRD
ncbi:LysR family transcriptional regulator [Rhodococcus sp. AD45-ID]|uniref:LysR family transcriptional regulator n=1 Tax=unclassified Rhodococcus (in: high G+C Gram-positive bacteria) TaxID=192944 RepID=UPI0005E87EA2|nr:MULTISPECIES: LysR family transcriptional regulator [unclassified Rhodococcus (in: high G+C Gram-positive bacteria)]KJF24607.1 Ben and cat operon transcriptional regulator [Rhodococcus sp. AD45]PSR42876.1 LysR family transcriptional regulator [Rhodococcus sp. AD45-ID]